MATRDGSPIKGRGAASNRTGRYESLQRQPFDDGWLPEDPPPAPDTVVHEEQAKSVLSRNQSPDIGFDRSVNPYRGCEHGCVYCYARPSHTWLNHSAGLDFETQLYAKTNVVEVLRQQLAKPSYRPQPIAFGTNTDPYQPIERRYRLMRALLELLLDCRHPLTVVSKGSALMERDLDLYAALAERRLVSVGLSVTTLDEDIKRTLEPRASSGARRLKLMRQLSGVGVPVVAMISPLIPGINDPELETILQRAAEAGARYASYTLLRLPNEVAPLFREWLELHAPLRLEHVMSLINQLRGGRDNDPRFGSRMQGQGVFADLLAQRFAVACKRLGLTPRMQVELDCTAFVPPADPGNRAQLALF